MGRSSRVNPTAILLLAAGWAVIAPLVMGFAGNPVGATTDIAASLIVVGLACFAVAGGSIVAIGAGWLGVVVGILVAFSGGIPGAEQPVVVWTNAATGALLILAGGWRGLVRSDDGPRQTSHRQEAWR
jgi:hypothetical protein